MSDLKLTIDQLKNYLGTGLKFHYQGEYDDAIEKPIEFDLHGISCNGWVEGFGKLKTMSDQYHIDDMFLLCYRLSDLDKFIPELGFVPIVKLSGYPESMELVSKGYDQKKYYASFSIDSDIIRFGIASDYNSMSFYVIQKLFQWHFWPFGEEYFEQGLVINKLKQGKEVSND